ncbi:MAG: hypothetical protein COV76_02790 [Candidatus Omnitrophica bacterium CG11_big_fil_rev_8_21_14_0_20_64_10]|nr:MAG: hypothetical protein COV76_02790 [Candidatus Omnitrophica bacterium CG11_big_fil_rev_8_21_14_0_20_64_10]
MIYGDFSANVAVVNDNLSVGTMTAPGAAPNTLEGNLRANDVYLRSTGQWLSQLGGGEQTRIGYYIGNGTASVNVLLGFEPRYVYIVEDQAASAPPFEMLESTQHYWVDHVASRNKSPRVWWSFPTSFQVKKAEYNRSGVRYYFIAYGGPERHFRFETD